jgi:hypothetical protein
MRLVNCDDETDLSPQLLLKLNKMQLSDYYDVLCKDLLKGAVNLMKTEHISLQKQILEQQKELLNSKSEQLGFKHLHFYTFRSFCRD